MPNMNIQIYTITLSKQFYYISSNMPIVLTSKNYSNYVNETANAIIDFSAEWCGPCKRMKPEYDAAEKFMQSIKGPLVFLTVDVDNEGQIAIDYNVQCMPTVVIIKDGKRVDEIKGFQSAEQILVNIGKHFDLSTEDSRTQNVNLDAASSKELTDDSEHSSTQ